MARIPGWEREQTEKRTQARKKKAQHMEMISWVPIPVVLSGTTSSFLWAYFPQSRDVLLTFLHLIGAGDSSEELCSYVEHPLWNCNLYSRRNFLLWAHPPPHSSHFVIGSEPFGSHFVKALKGSTKLGISELNSSISGRGLDLGEITT